MFKEALDVLLGRPIMTTPGFPPSYKLAIKHQPPDYWCITIIAPDGREFSEAFDLTAQPNTNVLHKFFNVIEQAKIKVDWCEWCETFKEPRGLVEIMETCERLENSHG